MRVVNRLQNANKKWSLSFPENPNVVQGLQSTNRDSKDSSTTFDRAVLHPDDRKRAEQLAVGSLQGDRNQSTVHQAH